MRGTIDKRIFLLGLIIGSAACGGSSTSPSSDPPAGSYTAVSFVTTGSSGQTNQLAVGSTLQLSLAAGGATSGHLHTAASGSDPAIDRDMAGTWALNGNVVTFSQGADSFVRDMPFTLVLDPALGWTLVGDKVFSGTRIEITLKRAP
jgi:hypothetical protein